MKPITKINPLHLIILIAVIELIALPIRELAHSLAIPSTLAGFIIASLTMLIIISVINNSPLYLQFFLKSKEIKINSVSYYASLLYSGLFLSLIFTIQPLIGVENLFFFGFILAFFSSFISILAYNILPLKVSINSGTKNLKLRKISLLIAPIVGFFEALILPFMDYFYSYRSFNPYVNSAFTGLLSGLLAAIIASFFLNLILKTKLIKIELS